jgi:MFS transporter, CP family, cyanate transporter
VSTRQASRASRRQLPLVAGGALLVTGILALAFNLRLAITGLPPVFPEFQTVLGSSAASLAVLGSLPVLCFGVFSGTAAPLARRFGEERVLGAALCLLALGLLARGLAPSVLLFPGTIVAGGSIALLNVLLPSLVKRRMPERAGLVIGCYLLMLALGAIVASLIAVPLFTAAGGGHAAARLSLAVWAAPALLAALIWTPQLRHRTTPEPGDGPRAGAKGGVLAMGRSFLAWQVMLFMGLQSLVYYATLSWFPTMFRDRGVTAAHAGDLLALMNLGNAVTALLLPVLAQRVANQRVLAALSAAATGAGIALAAFAPTGLAAGSMLLLGLGQGGTLGLAIFFTMARAPDPRTAASLSAFTQGAGYLIASIGPLAVGFLHTATAGWAVPNWVLLCVAVLELVTGWLAGRARTVRWSVPAEDRDADKDYRDNIGERTHPVSAAGQRHVQAVQEGEDAQQQDDGI